MKGGNALVRDKWVIIGIFIVVIIVVGILALLFNKLMGVAISVVFVLIFGLLIAVFYYNDKNLNKGEIRRSITITFVIMYIFFLCFSLNPTISEIPSHNNTTLNFGNDAFINNFHNAILVVLAFYFGSRALEVGMGARTKIIDWADRIFEKDIRGKTITELKKDIINDFEEKASDSDEVKKLKEIIRKIIDVA